MNSIISNDLLISFTEMKTRHINSHNYICLQNVIIDPEAYIDNKKYEISCESVKEILDILIENLFLNFQSNSYNINSFYYDFYMSLLPVIDKLPIDQKIKEKLNLIKLLD